MFVNKKKNKLFLSNIIWIRKLCNEIDMQIGFVYKIFYIQIVNTSLCDVQIPI